MIEKHSNEEDNGGTGGGNRRMGKGVGYTSRGGQHRREEMAMRDTEGTGHGDEEEVIEDRRRGDHRNRVGIYGCNSIHDYV